MRTPFTVVVIAKNEEDRIKECLATVTGWADEIVVVDDESVDRTAELARQLGAKVVGHRMGQEGQHRNFAADQASHDWIVTVDCDERLTEELRREMDSVLTNPSPAIVAYWAPKKNYLGTVQLKYGGWASPRIKLYHRKFVRWSEDAHDIVHPGIRISPGYRGSKLENPFIHYEFRNLEDFIRKINRYSTMEAVKWHLSGRKMTGGRAFWRAIDRFFRRYFGKKGYRDGYYGFAAAVMSSFHEFAAYSKYREVKEFGFYAKNAPGGCFKPGDSQSKAK